MAGVGGVRRSRCGWATGVAGGVGLSIDSTVGVGVAAGVSGVAVAASTGVAVSVPVVVNVGVAVGPPVGVAAGVPTGVPGGVAVAPPVGIGVTELAGVAVKVPVGVGVGAAQWTVRLRTLGPTVSGKEMGTAKLAPPLPAGDSPNGTRRNSVLLGTEEQVNDSSTKFPT